MHTVSGGRQSIGGGLRTEYDGGGAEVLGTIEVAVRVRGMREGYGGRVAVIPSDDAARKGEGGTVELGSLRYGRQPNNISDIFPEQGRDEVLPSGGLPRKGWDMDE